MLLFILKIKFSDLILIYLVLITCLLVCNLLNNSQLIVHSNKYIFKKSDFPGIKSDLGLLLCCLVVPLYRYHQYVVCRK